jgi:hypothetical protein
LKKILTEVRAEIKALDEFEESLRLPAQQMYILYKSYVDAGFSEEQALELIKGMLISGINQN